MNDKVPFFSIIMPCYNAERYLKDALDSVLAQTFTDWELILIDDGSKDHSLAIAQECLRDEPRAHIFSVPNGGVSKARNIGLDHAQGEWIFFMDADDLILPSHLQSYASAADCDIVFQGWEKLVDATGEVIDGEAYEPMEARSWEEINDLFRALDAPNVTFSATWSKIFRRAFIERWHIRFKEDIHNEEDLIFTLEYLAYAKSARLLPGASYQYRFIPKSLSNRPYRRPEDIIKQVIYYHQAFTQLPLAPDLRAHFEEISTCYYVQACLMLYHHFHLTLRRSKRLACLQACIEQAERAPSKSSAWFLQGDAKHTDQFHMKGYLRSCKQYLMEKLHGSKAQDTYFR